MSLGGGLPFPAGVILTSTSSIHHLEVYLTTGGLELTCAAFSREVGEHHLASSLRGQHMETNHQRRSEFPIKHGGISADECADEI